MSFVLEMEDWPDEIDDEYLEPSMLSYARFRELMGIDDQDPSVQCHVMQDETSGCQTMIKDEQV